MPSGIEKDGELELVRWYSWPDSAGTGIGSISSFLLGCTRAASEVSGGSEDEIVESLIRLEKKWLLERVGASSKPEDESHSLKRLDAGSEHIVFTEPDASHVIKVTRPDVFGDSYYLHEGRVFQRNCTPFDYLMRFQLLEALFGFGIEVLGVTALAQFVTRQKFIVGVPPTQDEIATFFESQGIQPVRESCWLWKKVLPDATVEFWLGDARVDNFVKTTDGLIPFDVRMWVVPL